MKNKNKIRKFNIALLLVLLFCLFAPIKGVENEQKTRAKTLEGINNSVVFLSFSKTQSSFPEGFYDDVYAMYQTANISVKSYFSKQSLGKFNLNTKLLYDNGECARASNPVEYYKPRYRWIDGYYADENELGYDNRYFSDLGEPVSPTTKGAKVSVEAAFREQQLIREVLKKCDLPSDYDNDYNSDGTVDSLVIISDVTTEASWGDLLWAHTSFAHEFHDSLLTNYYLGDYTKSELQDIGELMLGGNKVYSYNMMSLDQIASARVGNYCSAVAENEKHLYNVGILCHEMMHNIGLYDYYSYEPTKEKYQSVGEFSLMGSTGVVPQYELSYLRKKLGWLDYENFLYVNDSGDYTLQPVSSEGGVVACKIVLSDYLTTGEYFIAEYRSQLGATSNNPFDGGLSGSGLIVYRVNEKNAYVNAVINSEQIMGGLDLGNMYGDDEVYIYRMGNGNALNDPTGYTSYALLGNAIPPLTTDFSKYDNTQFGNADRDLTVENLFTSKTENSQTILHYSNGANSGIVFSNVTIKDDNSISFHVELPEKQGSMPILNPKDVFISRFINGKNRIFWNTNVKSGVAKILIIRSTDRLKNLAEKGNSHIAYEDFENGSFSYYTTLYSASLPLAEKYAEIPDFDVEALVFIALQAENGNCSVRYVGALTPPNAESFGQYVGRVIDPLYVYIAIVVLLFILCILTWIIISHKKQYKRKK